MEGIMEQYYDIRAAAQLLGMTVRTVRQWVHDGKIKAVQYVRRGKWYIPETEKNRVRNGGKK